MPTLKNTRHESFAQALASGMSRDAAYEKAGYKPHRQSAHKLLTKADIQARVDELQAGIAEKAEWSAADRLKMLADIAQASAEADPRVSVSAIAEANKMQGSHAPATQIITGAGGGPIQTEVRDLSGLSDKELAQLERLTDKARNPKGVGKAD